MSMLTTSMFSVHLVPTSSWGCQSSKEFWYLICWSISILSTQMDSLPLKKIVRVQVLVLVLSIHQSVVDTCLCRQKTPCYFQTCQSLVAYNNYITKRLKCTWHELEFTLVSLWNNDQTGPTAREHYRTGWTLLFISCPVYAPVMIISVVNKIRIKINIQVCKYDGKSEFTKR